MRKQPDKPSHITQAYQNVLRDPIVEHMNMSIRKIYLKNHYFNHMFRLKGTVQQINRKRASYIKPLKKLVLNDRSSWGCYSSFFLRQLVPLSIGRIRHWVPPK